MAIDGPSNLEFWEGNCLLHQDILSGRQWIGKEGLGMGIGMQMGMEKWAYLILFLVLSVHPYYTPSFGELLGPEAKYGFELGTFMTSLNSQEPDGWCGLS